MVETWLQTVSGKRVDLPIPKAYQIDITDIAYALAMKCRFNGQCKEFYSVAEHSVRVSRLLSPVLALAGLLHDANEAYLPDIPRPIKELIPEYKNIENIMDEAIYQKYGVNLTEIDRTIIKRADNVMLATEGRDLMGNITNWGLTEIPLKKTIIVWGIYEANMRFLDTFHKLIKMKGV